MQRDGVGTKKDGESGMRGNLIRLVVGVVAVALGGCTCETPMPVCTDSTITFETPMSGASVDSPFEVSVNVKNADGSAFNIDAAKLSVGGQTFTGTVSGNRATFTGVTAAAGAQTLSVAVAKDMCSKTATSTITVRDTCSAPAVTAIEFPQDVAPLGVLNATEIPSGTNLQVKVDATCVSDAQVQIKRDTTVVGGPVAFVNGTVTVTLTTLPDSDSARYDLFAELVRGGTALNTPTGNPAAQGSIQVSRAAPVVALTVGSSFGPADDADTGMSGFQVRVTGTAPMNTTCTISVPGATPATQNAPPNMMGDVSADFTVTSGSYTATLSCTDAAGNVGTDTATFTVDFDPPTVTITSPTNVDGGATMVITQSPTTVGISTTGAEDGSTVVVKVNGNAVGSGTVQNGMASVPASFGLDGTYTVTVEVTDAAGNQGTASITVVVQLSGCGAVFTRPSQCPALLTPAQLSGGNYSFQTTSNVVCNGQPAALLRGDVLADGGVGALTQVSTASLNSAGLANFPALMVANGDYVFRGQVSNLADGGVSVTSDCRVTVDLDGPVITSPVVPSGQMVAVINVAQDTQSSTPGVQRSLAFSARVPVGGRVDVCTTQAVDPVTMQQRPTSTECGSGYFVLQQNVTSPASGFTFPDGAYDLKIVVIGGGTSASSAPVSILSDSIPPCVQSSSGRLPRDANNDRRLNIVELNNSAPTLDFILGCGDGDLTTLSTTNPIVVRDVVGGAPGSTRTTTQAFGSGRVTVTVGSGVPTAEADLDLWVELTDRAGNRNAFVMTNDPGRFTFRVDPLAPSCDIQSPAASVTLVGQAQVPGGNFNVIVGTSNDVSTNGVRLTFGATTPRDLTPTNGSAQSTYAVTGTNSYAISAVCTDPSGNSTTSATRNVTIDLDAPVCAITAPTGMTYSSNQVSTTVTATGAEGRSVTVRSSGSATPLTSGTPMTIASGTSTATLTYPNGTQTVTAEVSDAAGNLCTATVANVNVVSSGCSLALTNAVVNSAGAWFNRSNTGSLTATAGVIASVNAHSSDCTMMQSVTLQRTAPTMGTALNGTVDGSGNVSFANVSVNDNETWTMTITNGAFTTPVTFRVGLRVPMAGAVTINGNAVTSGQDLFFVASSGNINLDPADGTPRATTYFADQSATADSQSSLTLATVSGANYGTDLGSIEVRLGATQVFSQPMGTEPYSLPATQITLAHNATGTFVVRVTSAAGNVVDVVSSAAAVDVKPPSAVTFVSAPAVTSSRLATVSATWSPSYDDFDQTTGGLVGGPAMQLAGYDVRWTTDLVTNTLGIPNMTTFFTRTLVNPDTVVSWQSTNITHAVTLPPINNYFVAVQARDEVGNYATFTAPTRITNRGTEDVLVNPTNVASQRFGGVLAGPDIRTGSDAGLGFGTGIGSVNSDLIDDLVVAAPNRAVNSDGGVRQPDAGVVAPGTSQANAGAVYVYFGRAGFGALSTCTLPNCQEILPYQSQASAFFGFETSMGNVDTAFNEPNGRLDLLVSSPNYDLNRGRVFLYFGNPSGASIDTSSYVEFRGQDYNSRLGGLAKVVPDINGDDVNEVLVLSRTEPLTGPNAGQGIAYLFLGRTRVEWLALASSTDPVTGRPYVAVSAATASRVLEGPTPVDNSGSPTNLFGSTRGVFSALGDLNADGRQDFVISANKNNLNRAYLYSGAAVAAASAPVPVPALLIDEVDKGTSGVATGFGTRTIGGLNVLGSSLPDLIATQARLAGGTPSAAAACYVKVFADGTSTGFGGASATIGGSSTRGFGGWAEAADFNGDGRVDIAVGESGAVSTSAWVFFQRTGQTFDTGAGGGFWQAAFPGPTASRRGGSMAVGDFDGDGRVDLAVGDELDTPGRVIVWH